MPAAGQGSWRWARKWDAPSRNPFVPMVLAVVLVASAARLLSSATAAAAGSFPRGRPVQNSSPLPVGLILPARLEKALSVKDAKKGVVVEARIMQDVPLPDREKIAMRAETRGSILAVEKDADGAGVKLTLNFNQLEDHKQTVAIATSLRALASNLSVQTAQTPFVSPDGGTPAGWADTVQIGGDIRYGDGGPVRNLSKQRVGKGVLGGVLVHAAANPSKGCEGPVNGDDHLQALWVFSADACGVYSLKGVDIVHTGKTPPIGEITLHFGKRDMKLEAGTALLLRVVAEP